MAARPDYSARFFRTDTLANQLMVLRRDDTAPMEFPKDLHLADVLVLDDFLTTPIDAATAHQLLNILAERQHRGSTIVTSQFTPDEWYKSIPNAVIAESILNRLVVGAEISTLQGPNMRLETHAK
ncbi:ATP-binding protein [Corynebacterium macginleyi]|uniref:ATP-binding protein n=1 Tax=Corynebacterium macginleyi TaxID=38290 RepID=UPI00190A1118|nr:ATP-binding protein [Corynebacterium macginleyi]MBK4163909.1 ATP-binding protein [Corynebacterium macginleyi]